MNVENKNMRENITKNKYLLECCVDSVESAIQAKKGGADRLELCSNLVIGGTTPTLALFRQIRETVDIPIHVLLRPRFGDFLYTQHEKEIILKEIEMFHQAGAEGIVIGCLLPQGNLDTETLKRFIDHSGSMSVTLHRAFDMCRDPFQSLDEAISLGIDTILTSGCECSCIKGIDLLRQLQEKSQEKITILAGAGVNETAVRMLLEKTHITAFHMSGKKVLESRMQFRNPHVSMGIPGMSEYQIWETDSQAVANVRQLLSAHAQW